MSTGGSFAALTAEVDRECLALGPHDFRPWNTWTGRRWQLVDACRQCGQKFEVYRMRQTCLGVLGELLLAGEQVPKRWTANFPERVRTARRAMKTKKYKVTR